MLTGFDYLFFVKTEVIKNLKIVNGQHSAFLVRKSLNSELVLMMAGHHHLTLSPWNNLRAEATEPNERFLNPDSLLKMIPFVPELQLYLFLVRTVRKDCRSVSSVSSPKETTSF